MKTFRNIDKLIRALRDEISTKGFRLISIDGKDGSGKSSLADNISIHLNGVHINLDDDKYLLKNKGVYVDYIKYDVLKEEIDVLLQNKKLIFIEGICILKIIERSKIVPELKIYAKKLTHYGYWFDGQNFDYSRSVEEIINKDEESLKQFIGITKQIEYQNHECIHHEVIRYHHEYKPNLNADYIYEWLQING